jgi:alanine dehydrogenase
MRQSERNPIYTHIAVLKETQPHERRVGLNPSVAAKLVKQQRPMSR